MARRSSGTLLATALVASAIYAMMPQQETFVAPSPSSHRVGSTPLAQGYELQARDVGVGMSAQTPTENQGLTSPRKINLLFIGLVAGSAAIGLFALLFYGSYSG
eukprot:CAMPEP_0198526846 /NCGR_PEP_ID=MMETSP1462-20131121/24196_1 /TAXON_ID=1333877 /ORGANISM="Brandtodinium nutriculum, Strain RCC3387" /LENGTH=103 /DNA_ID=CAMNT_0044256633 /DNA_START=1 /DNA_END=309 /DNA_ORIENTATION=+